MLKSYDSKHLVMSVWNCAVLMYFILHYVVSLMDDNPLVMMTLKTTV